MTNTIRVLLILSVLAVPLMRAEASADPASAAPAAENSWEQVSQTDGITVYKREVPGSPLLAFKGEGEIDAPLPLVATVIFDTSRAKEWVVDLESTKIVRWVSDSEFIEYDHIKTPPIIMKDRDFLSSVKMFVDKTAGVLTFHYKSVVDPAIPETDSLIRGDLMNTTFVLTSVAGNTKTHLIGEVHADPKGSVAKWIVNFFQKDWPITTLKNLRRQVAKPDVKAQDRFIAMFSPASAPAPATASAAKN